MFSLERSPRERNLIIVAVVVAAAAFIFALFGCETDQGDGPPPDPTPVVTVVEQPTPTLEEFCDSVGGTIVDGIDGTEDENDGYYPVVPVTDGCVVTS